MQNSLFLHLISLLCLKQWQASEFDDDEESEEHEKHINLYKQRMLLGPCSWGRGRVTHLLHFLVEEGTKVVSVIVQNALNISCLLDSWVDLCHDSTVCDNKP